MPLFLRHICIKLPQALLSVAYICARLTADQKFSISTSGMKFHRFFLLLH